MKTTNKAVIANIAKYASKHYDIGELHIYRITQEHIYLLKGFYVVYPTIDGYTIEGNFRTLRDAIKAGE